MEEEEEGVREEEVSSASAFRDLFAAAFAGPLNPTQQGAVVSEMRTDPELLQQCALTPQNVSILLL